MLFPIKNLIENKKYLRLSIKIIILVGICGHYIIFVIYFFKYCKIKIMIHLFIIVILYFLGKFRVWEKFSFFGTICCQIYIKIFFYLDF